MPTWNYIYFNESKEYVCKICECIMNSKRSSGEHVAGRRHVEAVSRYGAFIMFNAKNQYYCNLCKCSISSMNNVIEHINGQRHQDAFAPNNSKDDDSDCQDLDPYYFIVSENDNENYCFLCDYTLYGDQQRSSHAHSSEHQSAVETYGDDLTILESGWVDCDLCECQVSSYKCVYEHINGRRHQNALPNDSEDEDLDPHDFIVAETNDENYCFLCDYTLYGDKQLYLHADSSEHLSAVEKYGYDITTTESGKVDCNLCECVLSSYKCVFDHIIGYRHTQALEE